METLTLAFIIIGTVVGAGFATGQEIFQYFAQFGMWSLIFVPLAGVLFFLIYRFLLNVSSQEKFENYDVFSKKTFGMFSSLFSVFLCCCFVILCGSMYASLNELQFMLFDVDFPFLSMATAVLCLIVSLHGFSALSKSTIFTIPPIIIFLFILCVSKSDVSLMPIVEYQMVLHGLGSCVLYVGMNILFAGVFLVLVGEKYRKKQINVASGIAATLITVLMLGICICLISNPVAMQSEIPLLLLGFSVSKTFGYVFCIVIWCAVFSTLVSSSYTCMNMISSNNQFVSAFVVVLSGYIVSIIGFGKIVKVVYPVVGVVGIVFVVVSWFRFKRNKRRLSRAKINQ